MKSIADEIKGWVEMAARNTGVSVSTLSSDEAQQITEMIVSRFVEGLPGWWWAQLKVPCAQFDRQKVTLTGVLPSQRGLVYLIPEYPNHLGSIFRLQASEVETILNDCPVFEYSIVDELVEWLVSESHHDVLYVCKWIKDVP